MTRLPFDPPPPSCPSCGDLDVWVLGLVAGQTFVACRSCSKRWRTDHDLGHLELEVPASMFDAATGDQLKEAGIARASRSRAALLWFAKAIAAHAGRTGEIVTADTVQRELKRQGHDPSDLGNAAGALFRDRKLWTCVGFRNSARTKRQSGTIREWRRRDVHLEARP